MKDEAQSPGGGAIAGGNGEAASPKPRQPQARDGAIVGLQQSLKGLAQGRACSRRGARAARTLPRPSSLSRARAARARARALSLALILRAARVCAFARARSQVFGSWLGAYLSTYSAGLPVLISCAVTCSRG